MDGADGVEGVEDVDVERPEETAGVLEEASTER